MAEERMVPAAVVFFALLLCGAAVELQCNVTQDGSRTKYNISPVSDFISDPSSFDFSWSNDSHTVVANQEGFVPPVITGTIYSLVTSECIAIVHFTAMRSKGEIKAEYSATCNTSCSVDALPPITGTEPWIALGVLIPILILILILILVLAGLCVLWCKCKDKICKMLCDRPDGVFYRAVNMTNSGAEDVQV